MKKYGTLIALAVAVIFGIAAVILANKWMSTRVSDDTVVVKEQVPLTQIVIAGKDLSIGSLLSEDNLTMAEWPKANVPKGAFTDVKELVGRVIVTNVVAGTPLVAVGLAGEGSGVGLVAMIDPGMRAMSIRVDEVVGVGGFILPNTYVDVISVDTQGRKRIAKTILKRIEVLAVAQTTFVEEGEPTLVKTVTMEVAPKQAEQLAEVINKGPIHLVLRNPSDLEEEPKPKVAKSGKRTWKPRPKAKPSFSVELIQGDKPPEKYTFKQK
jgi:pilus assembly protein CpaB